MTMWGLGSLGETSYRTLIAQLADSLSSLPGSVVSEIADRWNNLYWAAYSSHFGPSIERAQDLDRRAARTSEEEIELHFLQQTLSGGFCVGGYRMPGRKPEAYEITFNPVQTGPRPPQSLSIGKAKFWGCPNIMNRLVTGADYGFLQAITSSPFWTGDIRDLARLAAPFQLAQPFDLPIREAIDWVFTSIYTTSQAMKFSRLAPVCGGPVEIASITTDRATRWVRHKKLDAGISHGGLSHV